MSSATGMMSTGEPCRAPDDSSATCLAGGDLARFEIDERLKEQLELLVGERLAQVQFQDAARLDGLRQLVAEEAEGAAARPPWPDRAPCRRSGSACPR